ncbi:hypothetical protein FG386_003305 [Cryptosporidium ryanae]|uniref:uncharacterized protein n=1 Tax=Cryptosporidium ryanae TaxID=515981 RepID=UPI00351A572C|nr:hypothetical protein FG386_003305 [Cryptosporidium ryanae]
MQPHGNKSECKSDVYGKEIRKTSVDQLSSEFGKEDFCFEEYLNNKFPDEHSLLNLEETIKQLQFEERTIDDEIRLDLEELGSSNAIADFENYLGEIENNLIPNMRLVDKLGRSSLNDIENIIDNVQSLDERNSNLIRTSKLLESVYVYALVLEEMKKYIKIREYSGIIFILVLERHLRKKLRDLLNNEDLSKVIKNELSNAGFDENKVFELIKKLIVEYEETKMSFKRQIVEDFMSLIDPCILLLNVFGEEKSDGLIKTNTVITPPQYIEAPDKYIKQMRSCCYCVDLVGGCEFRKEVINKFSERLLEPYDKLFDTKYSNINRRNKMTINGDRVTSSNTFGLDLLERRFSWYKRFINEYEQQFGEIFLTNWQVIKVLTEKYFICTRRHIIEILGDNGNDIDCLFVVRCSFLCYQFECYVISKFVQIYDHNILMSELEEYRNDGLFVGNEDIYKLSNKTIRNYYDLNEVEIKKTLFSDWNGIDLLLPSSPTSLNPLGGRESELEFYSKKVYPEIRGLLTECFIPYLASYFEEKRDSLRKKIKELTLNDDMMENSQIKREIYILNSSETIPLMWNSCMELFKLINTLFIEIKHLLSYDDVYFQFNSLIMQMGNFYLNIITQTCNMNINGITDKCANLRNISSGMNSSLENFVETVVNTFSNQTNKVVAAATTGIGEASTIIGGTVNLNGTSKSSKYISNGSSILISNIFGSGGLIKYDPKKIGATLGSIDYMEWMYDRLDKMVMTERSNMMVKREGVDYKSDQTETETYLNLKKSVSNNNNSYTTNHNIMFNNNLWIIRRAILDNIIRDIKRGTTPVITYWYTKKVQKRNDVSLNTVKTRGFDALHTKLESSSTGVVSLTDNLYDMLIGVKNNKYKDSYFQYITYMMDIYKYKVISQTMIQVLTNNLSCIVHLFKGQEMDKTTIDVLLQEINKLSQFFLELPSYYPNIYIPKAYINTINKLTDKSLNYVNSRNFDTCNNTKTVFNEYKLT